MNILRAILIAIIVLLVLFAILLKFGGWSHDKLTKDFLSIADNFIEKFKIIIPITRNFKKSASNNVLLAIIILIVVLLLAIFFLGKIQDVWETNVGKTTENLNESISNLKD